MNGVVYALAPVFLLILAGYVIKRTNLVADAFWSASEQITYYLFFPALVVHSIATTRIDASLALPIATVLIIGVAAAAGLAYAMRPILKLDGPAFASFYQASFRPNTYVAIAAAVALFGKQGMALIAIGIVTVVPIVNILSVLAMVRHASPAGARNSWRRTIVRVAGNPLILACLVGFMINVSGFTLGPVIGPLLETMGRAALPLALMTVGAGLDLKAMRKAGTAVATVTAIKLAALPMTVLILSRIIGMEGASATISVLYASVPVSASSYILARQMGGNSELAAATITATTLAAIIALPLWTMASISP